MAFTLIELISVMVILGVITATAFVRYGMTAERMRLEEGVYVLRSLYGAQKRYFVNNNNVYASNLGDLDVTIRQSAHFNTPTVQSSSPLASIGRTGGSYTLSISDAAAISCSGAACASLGY